MNSRHRKVVVALCLVAAGSIPVRSQVPTSALNRLSSPVDTVRVRAFYELRTAAIAAAGPGAAQQPRTAVLAERAKRDPQLGRALIALLHHENDLVRMSPTPSASDVMEYRVDLAVTVARMHDPTSVDDLLIWVSTGGPVCDALASFGETAVPGLMGVLESNELTHRLAAAWVLGRIAGDTTRSISTSAKAVIRTGLLSTLSREPITEVRLQAVSALAAFSDNDVRDTMERLAASDTAKESGRGLAPRFPVREAAKAWLLKHPR